MNQDYYVLVATNRKTRIREAITTPATKDLTEIHKENFARHFKREYKYFAVAKHPYKSHKVDYL